MTKTINVEDSTWAVLVQLKLDYGLHDLDEVVRMILGESGVKVKAKA